MILAFQIYDFLVAVLPIPLLWHSSIGLPNFPLGHGNIAILLILLIILGPRPLSVC